MKSSHDLVTEAKLHIREIDLGSADAAVEEADLLIDVREWTSPLKDRTPFPP